MKRGNDMRVKRTTSDQLLAQESLKLAADEVVDVIAEHIPGINIAYGLTKAYLGRAMKLRQQRVFEWVEFIRDHLGYFSNKIFETEEFQDCFVLLTEATIRERSEAKRLLHRKIFVGLTQLTSDQFKRYELEKLVNTINLISFKALNVMSFIKTNLLAQVEKDVEVKFKEYTYREGVEGIRLKENTRSMVLISDYISRWIHNNFGVESEPMKTKYGYTKTPPHDIWRQISYEEHLKNKELMEPLPEMANLGLLIKKDGAPTIGGTTGSGYSLSDFGYVFMDYLDS